MTEEALDLLLAAGETLTCEFKSDLGPLGDHEIFENVVCLANTKGGTLLLGVENDGTVSGLHPSRTKQKVNPALLQANIFNNTMPPINTRVEIHARSGHVLVSIGVDPYPMICATKEGVCKRRIEDVHGPACVPFYPMEHLGRRVQLGLEDLSAQQAMGASWNDLAPSEFERLRTFIHRGPGDQRLLELLAGAS